MVNMTEDCAPPKHGDHCVHCAQNIESLTIIFMGDCVTKHKQKWPVVGVAQDDVQEESPHVDPGCSEHDRGLCAIQMWCAGVEWKAKM